MLPYTAPVEQCLLSCRDRVFSTVKEGTPLLEALMMSRTADPGASNLKMIEMLLGLTM